jgi:membrane protease YdiL (CAAX protease family)
MDEEEGATVASGRHTLILTAILLAIGAAGYAALLKSHGGAAPAPQANGPGLYLSLIAVEIGLLYYVRAGLAARGVRLMRLISEAPLTGRRLAGDIAIGAALFLLLFGTEWLLARLLPSGDRTLVRPLIAAASSQALLWVALAAAAGLAEEVTFRGYYQRQLGAWLGSRWFGLVAQAALFGLTHGYQGSAAILRIVLLGLIFGLAALLRRSLVPGIIAHTALDIVGGLVR